MVLVWEGIKCETAKKGLFDSAMNPVLRAKVPGGWFVSMRGFQEASAFFYPDPEHTWDGSSLP